MTPATHTPGSGPLTSLEGREVLVVGLGRSGLAAARLCLARGAKVTVTDRAEPARVDLPGVRLRLGGHAREDFERADLVVLSPGVPLTLPTLDAARARGTPILGELELATRFLDAPVIAVTGTNGKSTTTALLGALFDAAGRRTFVGGNLGRPASEAVLAAEPWEVVVLEVSSFQLETTQTFHPTIAVVLNVTPDHLDRHGSVEAYAATKARIFEQMGPDDALVLGGDDPRVAAMAEAASTPVHLFTRGGPQPGGAWIEEGRVVLEAPDGAIERYRLGTHALRGPHNEANAAAAVLAARLFGLPPGAVAAGLAAFEGLPHRLESIRSAGEVEWVNDSKATNVESAVTALRAFEGGVLLIAGGRGKGASYAPLAEAGRGRLVAVLGIGEDGPAIVEALAPVTRGPAEVAGTLEEAVARAAALAEPGQTVLLSPACASYDQFTDYEARGERFRALVEGLV